MIKKLSCCRVSEFPRSAVALLGLLALLGMAGAPFSYAASMPEWLAAANRMDLGDFGQGSAAIIVERREEYTVDAAGRFLRKERGAIRILVRRAAEPYLRVMGYENSDQTVAAIKSWAIGSNGRVVESDKKDLATASGFAGFELFSDSRFKVITTPGVEDGSLVGYEITTEGVDHLRSERFRLEEEVPVWLSEVHVTVPSGSLRWFLNYPDRAEVVNPSPNSVTIRAQRRPAIPEEDNMPPLWSVAATVFVNYDPKGGTATQSWEEAGRTIQPYFQSARKLTPEIASEVDRITAGKTDLLSKLEAITDFASRNIRYVAIEIGVGAFQPHPAPDVYRYKYGDCKDKATLLLTMLDTIGLSGYPALLGTRGKVEANPDFPNLTTFNHLIAAIPVPAELKPAVSRFPAYNPQTGILWIDPTSDSHPAGELPEMDQGVYALILYPDRGEIQKTPEASPESNGREFQARVALEATGKGTATVRVQYHGDANAARHAYYRDQSQSETRKAFESRIARYVSQAAFLRAGVSGVEDNRQPVVEEFAFTGNFAAASTGGSWFFQPTFLSGLSVSEVGGNPRTHTLDLGAPYSVKEEYRIQLPTGQKIERIPEPVSLSSEFGSLQTTYELNGNLLSATQALSFTVSRIPPEKYADFREFVNRALRLGRQRLRVVKE